MNKNHGKDGRFSSSGVKKGSTVRLKMFGPHKSAIPGQGAVSTGSNAKVSGVFKAAKGGRILETSRFAVHASQVRVVPGSLHKTRAADVRSALKAHRAKRG